MRCPLRDMEEEDIGAYFDTARDFIDAAAAAGGAVLVHCHEGKSRSVTLVLAYFMQTQVRHQILTLFPSDSADLRNSYALSLLCMYLHSTASRRVLERCPV